MIINSGVSPSVHYFFGSGIVLVIQNPEFGRALCEWQLTQRHREILVSDHARDVRLLKKTFKDLLIGAHGGRCEYVFINYSPQA
jgi:hypothetical protein